MRLLSFAARYVRGAPVEVCVDGVWKPGVFDGSIPKFGVDERGSIMFVRHADHYGLVWRIRDETLIRPAGAAS